MARTGIRELLEAGVHFGHQTRRWNPRMASYIHGERQGIYIIDLLQTEALLEDARIFVWETARRGGTVLFVGTKKQANSAVKEAAERCGMPYVNHRWLGGLLTNFQTISKRIKRLHDLDRYAAEGQLALLPTRERLAAEADRVKLTANLGGVRDMGRTPDAVVVFDINTEEIAVKEANRLRIPVIGLVDTNCDPSAIDFVIPGNDDAMRSCALIADSLADAILEARGMFLVEEEKAREAAAARAAAEKEDRERREAEEAARRLAVEEEAASKAAAQAAAIEAAEAERALEEEKEAVRAALAERAAQQAAEGAGDEAGSDGDGAPEGDGAGESGEEAAQRDATTDDSDAATDDAGTEVDGESDAPASDGADKAADDPAPEAGDPEGSGDQDSEDSGQGDDGGEG